MSAIEGIFSDKSKYSKVKRYVDSRLGEFSVLVDGTPQFSGGFRSQKSPLPVFYHRDIETAQTLVPSHSGGMRQVREIESSLTRAAHDADSCERIYLVDDVLVTGAHFVGAKSLLAKTGFSGELRGPLFARAEY